LIGANTNGEARMNMVDAVVYVVDDDSRVARGLSNLLAAEGYKVVTFATAEQYISFERSDSVSCLVLDLELPDINGLELQQKLADTQGPPIIFITGHGDIPSGVKAMKNGAIEFLTKPIESAQLLEAIRLGVSADQKRRRELLDSASLRARLASLTPREVEVFRLVVAGFLNKQAAAELGITETTIDVHRGRVMRKMKANSLPDLVRMSTRLGILADA
jgi:FixJ family two-component response regulator